MPAHVVKHDLRPGLAPAETGGEVFAERARGAAELKQAGNPYNPAKPFFSECRMFRRSEAAVLVLDRDPFDRAVLFVIVELRAGNVGVRTIGTSEPLEIYQGPTRTDQAVSFLRDDDPPRSREGSILAAGRSS